MFRPFIQIVGFATLLHISDADEKCDPDLGCFELGEPFRSTLRLLPDPQDKQDVNTTFTLYRRGDEQGIDFPLYPEIELEAFGFDFKKPSVFIVHGFAASEESEWMVDLKTAYLEKRDVNVFLTDWEKGASSPMYLQSASNTRVVGREISRLIRNIETNGGKAENVHCIGHSLGAHCCAYAGKNLTNLGLLTGLDPAQPAFEGFADEVRLTPNDAGFVDVLHTDSVPFIPLLGLGMISACGKVDFYFNGKGEQPGCVIGPKVESLRNIGGLVDLASFPFDLIYRFASCSHNRAPWYYIEAIKGPCIFWGQSLSTWKTVVSEIPLIGSFINLNECTEDSCTPLGLDTSKFPFRGKAYVKTSAVSPYCSPFPGKFSSSLGNYIAKYLKF